jgi:hypothetical protein
MLPHGSVMNVGLMQKFNMVNVLDFCEVIHFYFITLIINVYQSNSVFACYTEVDMDRLCT